MARVFDVGPKVNIADVSRPLPGTPLTVTPPPGGSGPAAPPDRPGSTLTPSTATGEADLAKLQKKG